MLNVILLVYLYLVIQMAGVWILYKLTRNPSIVDMTWSLGLLVAGLIYLSAEPVTLRSIIIASLLVIWALRLSFYLWLTRVRLGHVDKRYKSLGNIFLNYQLQGLFILVLSCVFYFASHVSANHLSLLDIAACCIIAIGISGETIADRQLQKHKIHYPKQLCNSGLWYYSRHPNYFFDWLSWCGFAMFAWPAPLGCLGVLSPLFLYVIFTRITGPMTENHSLASRGQLYLDYQKQTSMFFPWFKRPANVA